jgi:hypothetical protein
MVMIFPDDAAVAVAVGGVGGGAPAVVHAPELMVAHMLLAVLVAAPVLMVASPGVGCVGGGCTCADGGGLI